jgi:hypothetical protein
MLEKQFLLNEDGSYPNGLNEQVISALGLIAVLPSPAPNDIPQYHYVEETDPVLIDGVYVQQWKITKHSDEEIAEIDKESTIIINDEMNSNQV